MPRAQQGRRICERKAREALAVMERTRNLMSDAPEDLRKPIFQEIRDLDEKISGEEMELQCRSGGRES